MDGRRMKFLNIINEYSCMCLTIRVGRRGKAVDVITAIEALLERTTTLIGTAPGSPWENPFVESFNGRFRDEFLNIELFASLADANVLAKQHQIEYNIYRPNSTLHGRTPLESPPAMESGLITPTAFIRTRATRRVASGTEINKHRLVDRNINAR